MTAAASPAPALQFDERVATAVREGLTARPKRLPAWLFYDRAGSRLFDAITELDEYYLTRTERGIFLRATRFVSSAFGNKFVFEFCDKTLHRPRAGLAKGANRSAAGNVIRDFDQIIRVTRAAFAVRETMERLAHPKRAFAAWSALAAAFVREELAYVRQCLNDVG